MCVCVNLTLYIMKNLLLTSLIILPSLTFAGGIGGVSLGDYNIVEPDSTVTTMSSSSLSNSSEAPRLTEKTTSRSSERRRGFGFRLPTRTTSSNSFSRRSQRRSFKNYWNWVDAQRTATNATTGVTRTGDSNFGDIYELSTGLEPIDPNDNTFRGLSRESERQSAAQRKMLRLRRR